MKTFTKLLALAGLTLITMVSCNNISESQKADIVLENIFARKSVRKFTSEPVSDKQVETLLRSSGHLRLHFYLLLLAPNSDEPKPKQPEPILELPPSADLVETLYKLV